jgi:lipopolysaccharide transport system ATP-binding protein
MADDVVISAEGLSKKYAIGHTADRDRYVALRDVLARGARNLRRSAMDLVRGRPMVAGDEVEEFWALKDINFEIKRGEVVGVIGRNGAGKSTLLKILSRITEPSEGRVTIKGRVASLLEVGTGFHPELTGRENIYLNGAILGMSRAEIKRKFYEIVDFAEVERFLDTPVKRYSSGMYVRLAFAVAAHLEPEILVVDEVLAVGDAEFQRKCLGKMGEVAAGGRTVLFVSHNMVSITALCRRVLLFSRGGLVDDGNSTSIVTQYLSHSTDGPHQYDQLPTSAGFQIYFQNAQATQLRRDGTGDFCITIKCAHPQRIAEIAIIIQAESGLRVALLDLRHHAHLPYIFSPGYTHMRVNVPHIALIEGRYRIGAYLNSINYKGDLYHIGDIIVLPPLNAADVSHSYDLQYQGISSIPIQHIEISHTSDFAADGNINKIEA